MGLRAKALFKEEKCALSYLAALRVPSIPLTVGCTSFTHIDNRLGIAVHPERKARPVQMRSAKPMSAARILPDNLTSTNLGGAAPGK